MTARSRAWFYALAIFWATLVVYAQVARFGLVAYDDPDYVVETRAVAAGVTLEGVGWAFTTGRNANWHPLTWISYMLDVEVHGGTPAGFHVTNLALHILNALLLFGLLRTMTGSEGASALVAALFALHPLHVEPVAWVSARKDLLSTTFWFLATWVWVAWTRRGGAGRYALAAALLALGLMAKPMLVTLPFTLLLLDVWPLGRVEAGGRNAGRLVLEKVPLFALAAVSSTVTWIVQRRGGAMGAADLVSAGEAAANAIVSVALYLVKTLWPVSLVVHVPHPYLPKLGGTPLAAWQVLLAAGLLAAVTGGVYAARRRDLWVGWLWFLGTLVPVLGLVQVGTSGMADRYTYIPHVGLFVMVAWGGAALAGRSGPRAEAWLRAGAFAVLAACAALSFLQARHWRDPVALYEHGLAVTPGNVTLLYNYGHLLFARGELDEAVERYREVLAVDPASYEANVNLGIALQIEGDLESAIEHLRRAVATAPEAAAARYNLANALAQKGELREAIEHYERAAEAQPLFAEAHYGIGNALVELGESDEAIRHYRRALEIRPDFPEARNNLDLALSGERRGLFSR